MKISSLVLGHLFCFGITTKQRKTFSFGQFQTARSGGVLKRTITAIDNLIDSKKNL